jgi:uncharacterized protein
MRRLLPPPTGSSLWARILLFALVLAALPVVFAGALAFGAGAGCEVCISQAYGHGGKSGSAYNADFVELFNRSSVPTSLTGWHLDYADARSESWRMVDLGALTLQPYSYALIALRADAAGTPLPPPDLVGNANLVGSAGKLLLVNDANTRIDVLGYGDVEWAEGAPALGADAGMALLRADGGCTDSDNNAADFVQGPPQPRNSQDPPHTCGGSEPPTPTATPLPIATPMPSPSPTFPNTPTAVATDTPTPVPAPTLTATPVPPDPPQPTAPLQPVQDSNLTSTQLPRRQPSCPPLGHRPRVRLLKPLPLRRCRRQPGALRLPPPPYRPLLSPLHSLPRLLKR